MQPVLLWILQIKTRCLWQMHSEKSDLAFSITCSHYLISKLSSAVTLDSAFWKKAGDEPCNDLDAMPANLKGGAWCWAEYKSQECWGYPDNDCSYDSLCVIKSRIRIQPMQPGLSYLLWHGQTKFSLAMKKCVNILARRKVSSWRLHVLFRKGCDNIFETSLHTYGHRSTTLHMIPDPYLESVEGCWTPMRDGLQPVTNLCCLLGREDIQAYFSDAVSASWCYVARSASQADTVHEG